jgi:hypothetical protein
MKIPPVLLTCAALQLGAILAVAQTTNRAPNLVDPATSPPTAEIDPRLAPIPGRGSSAA